MKIPVFADDKFLHFVFEKVDNEDNSIFSFPAILYKGFFLKVCRTGRVLVKGG